MIQFRSFLPFLKWPRLSASLLRSESLAGLTVGLMVIPQSVAYAALALLLRWVFGALAALRQALTATEPDLQSRRAYAVYQALLPLILIGHNVTESSYFAGNSVFGFLILLLGVELDLRRRQARA